MLPISLTTTPAAAAAARNGASFSDATVQTIVVVAAGEHRVDAGALGATTLRAAADRQPLVRSRRWYRRPEREVADGNIGDVHRCRRMEPHRLCNGIARLR